LADSSSAKWIPLHQYSQMYKRNREIYDYKIEIARLKHSIENLTKLVESLGIEILE